LSRRRQPFSKHRQPFSERKYYLRQDSTELRKHLLVLVTSSGHKLLHEVRTAGIYLKNPHTRGWGGSLYMCYFFHEVRSLLAAVIRLHEHHRLSDVGTLPHKVRQIHEQPEEVTRVSLRSIVGVTRGGGQRNKPRQLSTYGLRIAWFSSVGLPAQPGHGREASVREAHAAGAEAGAAAAADHSRDPYVPMPMARAAPKRT